MAATSDPTGTVELSVIAPCFNEAANLSPLVTRLLAVFERRSIAGEIVLVNDGSSDATGQVIDELAARHPEVVPIHHPENRGLSAAWDTGLAAAGGMYVCFIDADLQNPPEEVWRLYREITQSRVDLVQGVRSPIGRLRDGRYTTSRVLNLILNLAFGMSARDNKSGFVMGLRETMTDTLRRRFRYRYFHVFITVAAHAKGFTIREVETLFQSRAAGQSFISRWPVRLVAEVCLDLAKAFVEFRLRPERIDALEQFLGRVPPTREPPRCRGWRRLFREAYFLSTALRKPLLTWRVRGIYHALVRTQWTPAARLRELQEVRLRRMIRHAYHHVAYYREAFDRLGIRPGEIRTLKDLPRLPLLSKRDVGESLYFDLFADNHRKPEMLMVTTSGPSREPLVVYVDRMQLEMRLAGALRALEWTGWRFGDRPFGARVFDGRGRPEIAGIAHECEIHGHQHVAAESYIVEVLKDGRTARPGEVGELVVTDLNGFSVPLIRYQTGDLAVAMDDTPCDCGRGLPRIGRASPPAPPVGHGDRAVTEAIAR